MKYGNDVIAEHQYNMKTRGYSILENYLAQDTIERLKVLLMESIDAFSDAKYSSRRSSQDKYHIHDLLTQNIAYAKLLEDERLQQLAAPLLGEHWIMYAFTSSSAPPNSTNYGGRVHVDSPRWISSYPTNIGVIWALDDFTKENGATKVLPASHHSEEAPSKKLFERNAIQVECPRGSIVFFDSRVFHCTGFNSTGKWRHALTLNLCRSFMKQRMDWVKFIPAEISDCLNEQARRAIGFDTRIPKSLEEFFVPDDERLYKAKQG